MKTIATAVVVGVVLSALNLCFLIWLMGKAEDNFAKREEVIMSYMDESLDKPTDPRVDSQELDLWVTIGFVRSTDPESGYFSVIQNLGTGEKVVISGVYLPNTFLFLPRGRHDRVIFSWNPNQFRF